MGLSCEIFKDAAAFIATWKKPLLLSHARPDGDAIGCLVAMRSIFHHLGAEPLALLFDPVPPRYAFLNGDDPLEESQSPTASAEAFAPDGIVIADTCSRIQLDPVAEWLAQTPVPKLVVDHHITRDVSADVSLIDESASSASLLVYEWARAVDWPRDNATRDALFVGVATDTGWFRFSNTDPRTLNAAAALVEAGANPARLYEHLYHVERPQRLCLLAAAISTLDLQDDGRIAMMSLGPDEFARAGAAPADTEDLVNEPMRIDGVIASVLLVVQGGGVVRVSLRSKAPGEGVADINMAQVAAQFGGGGHARAAGARIPGTIESVKTTVLKELLQARAQAQT